MRILSWNINGIRTLPQYHPWNTFKECQGILDELKADIICFQEMKSSRRALPRDVAIPPKYSSFFSFPAAKGGYSGVAVYARSDTATPLKAEEGLSGKLQPKPPLTAQERISSRYPSVHDINTFPDEKGNMPINFDALDSEGRGLVLDFGLFVLINVYCPNETSDARTSFKMNYHLLLEERVRILMQEGREVIVLGDMNICATPEDHCEGHLPSVADTFWEHPARAWFQKWLHPQGPMVDVVRTYWPERKGMFTCWNQKIQARETNYGTRVDYILVTSGLLKWIKHGDIQPSLKGSDHCPIYIDLHDQITLESGETLKLYDIMKQDQPAPKLPRIAAKHWSEFKQSQISAFFGKRSSSPIKTKKRAGSPNASGSSSNKRARQGTSGSGDKETNPFASSSQASSSSATNAIEIEGDKEIPNPGMGKGDGLLLLNTDQAFISDPTSVAMDCPPTPTPTPPTPPSSPSKAAWTNLFTPIQPPKCTVHGEPTTKFTVNKAGPNKGRSFYVCSRPVGPGYDKGRESRQWQEVDHQHKCNYFKWASEVKRDHGGPPSPTKR